MFKHISALFIVLLFAVLSDAVHAFDDVMNYDSEYKNIKVGQSTLQSLKHHHGKAVRVVEYDNFTKYRYKKFDATINHLDGKVRTIIIFDRSYKDANYLSIGESRSKVERTLRASKSAKHLVDNENGIVYWFSDDKVSKIVLAHQLRR
ncbi:hypothetical protein L4D06_18445 [Enterovibrio makurazakiensis]|uniref:hypothetical protein n=1 Tax=Enterovibrio makurazakiensis TaxID=2910232 RepID=UPI003D1AB752